MAHTNDVPKKAVCSHYLSMPIGLSTLITPLLALIPMPVLFGVFLFMGVSSLKGLQFVERLLLLFIPRKYQPEYVYLKYVPLSRVHMFTLVQLFSLVSLWLIKNNQTTSIGFPVMLVVICAIRKVMECVFTKRELRLLDDLLPEDSTNRRGVRPIMIRQFSRKISKHNMAKVIIIILIVVKKKNINYYSRSRALPRRNSLTLPSPKRPLPRSF